MRNKLVIVLVIVLLFLPACGIYRCDWCGKVFAGSAYYDAGDSRDTTICADCAKRFYNPFPYTDFKKESFDVEVSFWGVIGLIIAAIVVFSIVSRSRNYTGAGMDGTARINGYDKKAHDGERSTDACTYVAVECSFCGRKVYFREDDLSEGTNNLECPFCSERIELEYIPLLQKLKEKKNVSEQLTFFCPQCGKELYYQKSTLSDENDHEVTCPYCDKSIFLKDIL